MTFNQVSLFGSDRDRASPAPRGGISGVPPHLRLREDTWVPVAPQVAFHDMHVEKIGLNERCRVLMSRRARPSLDLERHRLSWHRDKWLKDGEREEHTANQTLLCIIS